MGIELERRFLVNLATFTADTTPRDCAKVITQSYLNLRKPSIRLRRTVISKAPRMPAQGDTRISTEYTLTIKTKHPTLAGASNEDEYPLNAKAYNHMVTGKPTLDKVRVCIGPWEVDLFTGPLFGLCIAEIELQPDGSGFPTTVPNWVGPEITSMSRLSNASLVEHNPKLTLALIREKFPWILDDEDDDCNPCHC